MIAEKQQPLLLEVPNPDDAFNGVSFNYTKYFAKYRDRRFVQRKSRAQEFVERLESAIQISVRMTGGDVVRLLNLDNVRRRLSRNRNCNVCNAIVAAEKDRFMQCFRAVKLVEPDRYTGFDLEWTHDEGVNGAQQLSVNEWISGPLLFCTECMQMLFWCEEHVRLKHAERGLETRNYKDLPLIVDLYANLEKKLLLAHFFRMQLNLYSRDPDANAAKLSDLKRCISSNCGLITAIGRQIGSLGSSDGKPARGRMYLLQQNIAQYSMHVVEQLCRSFSFDQSALREIILETERANHPPTSVWDGILDVLLCAPIRHRWESWHKTPIAGQ